MSSLGEVYDIFDSDYSDKATGGKGEIPTVSIRECGEDEGSAFADAELWGHAPLVYRPGDKDDKGVCQAVTAEVGGRVAVVGTKDARAAEASGALKKGDVALVNPWGGKCCLRLNASGGVALLKQGDDVDASISIDEDDDAIVLINRYGGISIGPNGIVLHLTEGPQVALTKEHFMAFAPQAFLMAGVVGLGPAPSKPLCTGAGAAAVPIPYILG